MKRREFITLVGGAAAAWPLAARAQPTERVRRIGMLVAYSKDDPEDQRRRVVFQESLQHLGWTVGRNIHIEYRWYGGEPERARVMAKELVEIGPDMIVAGTTPALAAVARRHDTSRSYS